MYTLSEPKRTLKKLPAHIKERIGRTLSRYRQDPHGYSETLIDAKLGTYRFRIGDYRVFFDIEGSERVVLRVGHRRDIYRRLYDYYRLAHRHRTCINWLPCNWKGSTAFAPDIRADGTFDWTLWDRQVGPLLDGSAFADLPRAHEPVDVFYLPFNENWPVNLYDHFTPSYGADEAFTTAYARAGAAAADTGYRACAGETGYPGSSAGLCGIQTMTRRG